MNYLNFDQITKRFSDKAKQAGVELEILMESGTSFSVSYQNEKLDPFQSAQTHAVGFRVIEGDCESISFSESTDESDLDLTFDEALSSVKLFPKSYKPELVEPGHYEEMDFLYSEDINKVSVEAKLEKAKAIEGHAKAVSSKIQAVPYQSFANSEVEKRIFNTKGVNASYKTNAMWAYAYALANQGEDNQMAADVVYSKDFSKLDVEKMAQTAANKAINKLGAIKPDTGIYPVVFTAEMTQSLLSLFESHFYADRVDKNLSLLKGKLDQVVASSIVEIWDDPFLKKGPDSRPFDSEGTPSKRTCVVKSGALQTYLTNSVYAKKMNLENTASASRGPKSSLGIGFSNLFLKPADKLTKPLTSEHDKLILIDFMQGLHSGFDSISGDFSIQSEGYMYEGGQRVGSVNGFVVSGNIMDLLKNISAVGDDLQYDYKHVICPSILVSKLSIAGK